LSKNTSKTTAFIGIFTALAMVFSYMETFISFAIPVPGIKLGLANIVTVTVLYKMGAKEAVLISIIRILLSTILFGNTAMLVYSLAGAWISLIVMILIKKLSFFGVTGVSIAGGVCHNIGQLAAAAFFLDSGRILYYLPVLMIAGTVAGVIIGIAAGIVTKRVRI
jgi:heptaprenyl diphosphate synthase